MIDVKKVKILILKKWAKSFLKIFETIKTLKFQYFVVKWLKKMKMFYKKIYALIWKK